MSFELSLVLVLIGCGVSAYIGYVVALKGAPKKAEMEALKSRLETARSEAEQVQSNVTNHFEQSAVLFGKLAQDYREFLEHFSDSAKTLGLSESRARELLEQVDQPLIEHSSVDSVDSDVEEVEAAVTVGDQANLDPVIPPSDDQTDDQSEVLSDDPPEEDLEEDLEEDPEEKISAAPETTTQVEPPLIDDVVEEETEAGPVDVNVVDVALENPAAEPRKRAS